MASNEEEELINTPGRKDRRTKKTSIAFWMLVAVAITVGIVGAVIAYKYTSNSQPSSRECRAEDQSHCKVSLVETIPENLTYPHGSPVHMATYDAWYQLLQSAQSTVDIASFYWTLLANDTGSHDPTDWKGQSIYKELIATYHRGVKIRVVQSQPSPNFPNTETETLSKLGIAVRSLDMGRLMGGGILHTKLWIVDSQHFYSGSANTDWRSLAQVKELGHLTWNCSCMVSDMEKIFDVYWKMAEPDSKIPSDWGTALATMYSARTPMNLSVNGIPAQAYVSSSPAPFCPSGRTNDLQSIMDVMRSAQHRISVAVMDYFPTTLYTHPRYYWPVLDDEMRRAAFDRGVHVRLMASLWNHTRPDLADYLCSLAAINGTGKGQIEVRLFEVPAYTEAQRNIPYSRVNHNKYMVTDNAAYIGTSNWSGDYFIDTCGVGYIMNQTSAILNGTLANDTIQGQLQAVFHRDWNSEFAKQVC